MVESLLKVLHILEGPATSRTPESVEHVGAAISKDRQLTEADLGVPETTVLEILMQDLA